MKDFCSGKYTKINSLKHKKTDKHKKWIIEKSKSKELTFEDIPEDIVFYHILPWIQQFKFGEQRIPRMLIDYTRIENPNILAE